MNTERIFGTIKLSSETKESLKTFGVMGESYEDVIKRLIFIVKNGKFKKVDTAKTKELRKKL